MAKKNVRGPFRKVEYVALTEFARPQVDESIPGFKAGSKFTPTARAFVMNLMRARALATLPGVVVAHAMPKRGRKEPELRDSAPIVERYTTEIGWVHDGIKNLYTSVLISAWTAFEVLAGDLWVEAVNRFPLLGLMALDVVPLPNDTEDEGNKKAKKTISVVAQRLMEPSFDIRGEMGNTLRDNFPMTKFTGIIKAYTAIFRHENGMECKKLLSHPDIRLLSAIRNVLVHSAGNADEDFMEQVKNNTTFSGISKGSPIEINCHLTVNLLKSVRDQGYALLRFVDEWCESRYRPKHDRQ